MKTKAGFTLIELIVVIAIIAILGAIIAPNAFRAIEKAKIAKAVADYKTLKQASYSLYADTGKWPIYSKPYSGTSIRNTPLLRDVGLAGWDGPYLEKDPDPHPWAGIYAFIFGDWDSNNAHELILSFNDNCHPHPANPSTECDVPLSSTVKIEKVVDDGNLSAGEVRLLATGDKNNIMWAIARDALPYDSASCSEDPNCRW